MINIHEFEVERNRRGEITSIHTFFDKKTYVDMNHSAFWDWMEDEFKYDFYIHKGVEFEDCDLLLKVQDFLTEENVPS